MLSHTEVTARDSIGYIRIAWQLQHNSWIDTVRNSPQHPGYPLALLAMSYPVRMFSQDSEPRIMQWSAQLASALAGILLVIPMYFLGRILFNPAVGFWSALLFQCLPASGRVFPDGLSEGVFLLFAASGFLAAVLALRRHSPAWFALTGLFGGLAYLTRPEGALIIFATGLVLLALQAWPLWRVPWRRVLLCTACLAATTLATGGPLMVVTGTFTVKNTPRIILDQFLADLTSSVAPTSSNSLAGAGLPGVPPPALCRNPLAMISPLAVFWTERDGSLNWRWAGKAMGIELCKGCGYLAWLPMLLGLWWFRDGFRHEPGTWVLVLVCLALIVLLERVAVTLGYLSDRHMLLIILGGSYWATAALFKMGCSLQAGGQWLTKHLPSTRRWQLASSARGSVVIGTVLLLILIGSMLPKTLEPLHLNRKGFRHAGVWLAEQSAPWDEVIDPYCWSHYYSGKLFQEERPVPVPAGVTPTCYVVLEVGGNEHSRLPLIQEALRLSQTRSGGLALDRRRRQGGHRRRCLCSSL